MKRFLRLVAAAAPVLMAGVALGDIAGSKHDFSAATWSDNEICKPCHTPHNGDVSLTGRLWSHTMSQASYKYHGGAAPAGAAFNDGSTSREWAQTTVTQSGIDAASRLCLSCHDGTVALDSFMGKTGGSTGASIDQYKTADGLYNPNLGGSIGDATVDLSNDHPVGYSARYDETSGSAGHYRYKPLSSVTGAGLKLAKTETLYAAGKVAQDGTTQLGGTNMYSVSCVSCHNVHNAGAPDERGLLRISNLGSAMCLTCHNK